MEHPLLQLSYNIPKEIRPDVIEVVQRNHGRIRFSFNDLEYLFEVYNRYIAREDEPEDKNCRACRAKVISKLRTFVTLWISN